MESKLIKADHGYGGEKTRELIREIILPKINNPYANKLDDSAVMPFGNDNVVFTADCFVVNPYFFPGGDIGKLAVAGVVNDIVAQGGKPLYLSVALILEEGFSIKDLDKIAESTAKEADTAGVKIVCGDIKVVEQGKGDSIYISSSAIGEKIVSMDCSKINEGDAIIIADAVGEHGAAIFQARSNLLEKSDKIKSDCRSLVDIIGLFEDYKENIKFMRDPTRGGLAQVMIELVDESGKKMKIEEDKIPVKDWVKGLSYITGLDYLYLACEGNMVIVIDSGLAKEFVGKLAKIGFENAALIGFAGGIKDNPYPEMLTVTGGRRYLTDSDIAQIPRIC